jgi:phospholipase/carboxylesterase
MQTQWQHNAQGWLYNPPQANAALIWMHGLGANADDFLAIMQAYIAQYSAPLRIFLPQAPLQAVSINMGMRMPAWYDISSLEDLNQEDRLGLQKSATSITNIIQSYVQEGIPSEQIILGGFSQGGALALHVGLSSTLPLAAIFATASYLPKSTQLPLEKMPSAYLYHGKQDNVVSLSKAKKSYQRLFNSSNNYGMQEYDCAHNLNQAMQDDLFKDLYKLCSMFN